ncbi:MAG TPA: alkaline phosphatase family protein [Acidobacteriaceae bacterium]|nr:alkaline phosphatase family protein [Acidobacteriaceae bacterium]
MLLLAGCGASGSKQGAADPPSAPTAPATPQSKHVVMVMEENQSYSSVVGNTSVWPNYNSLIQKGALATNYYADMHHSISDYFILTTGQMQTNNDGSTTVWDVDSIARHMLSAAVSFKVYAEGIQPGYLGGDTGAYVIRHNPFAMLSDVANNSQVANTVLMPFTQFGSDLASGSLPEFSFIVPNVNDDAHNGTPQQADSWLQSNVVQPLMNDKAFQTGGDGVLIVLFDESIPTDVVNGGGHVAAVFWGPRAKAGYTQQSATLYLHESMLHTVMMLLNLPNPPGSAASAPTMDEFLVP